MSFLQQIFNALPNVSRFYDLNLRAGFDSGELVAELIAAADVVKMNESEAHTISDNFGLPRELDTFCRQAAARFGWRAASVTLGDRGCVIFHGGEVVFAHGHYVKVADTVGAGDAFAAAFLHGLINGWSAQQIASFANRVGALVASRPGAIPAWNTLEAALL
jgi:fructokinase